MDWLSYTVNCFTSESRPADDFTKDQVETNTFSRTNPLKHTFPLACLFDASVLRKISCIYYLIILNHKYKSSTNKRRQKIEATFFSHFNKILQVIGNLIILPHFPTNSLSTEEQADRLGATNCQVHTSKLLQTAL